ncbi:AfsA-related hotdog domain-containing protein [Streptomyces sp. NBC_01506]|uniref:AfsA-related hotdog domain-containing protein n=1 Tax=Streptomyces sp. NBC_01506 TaxID=2903887 RepID=UPI00387001D2
MPLASHGPEATGGSGTDGSGTAAGATGTGGTGVAVPAPPAADALSFAAPYDPALLHRRNPDEVFLTDVRALGDRTPPEEPDNEEPDNEGPDNAGQYADAGRYERFAAAALLPSGHPHYGGLTGPAGNRPDPMLLLECCRQAETYAAHALFGVEQGVGFILRGLSVRTFPDAHGGQGPAADAPSATASTALSERGVGAGPASRLVMACQVREPGQRRGAVSSLDYTFDVWAGAGRIARIVLRVGYAAPRVYAALRARRRGGPPPTSRTAPPPVAGTPVEPSLAGRLRATDCVLLDLATGPAAEVTAALRVPVENVSYFDHPHDHVPGMVLVEAARQLATAAVGVWDAAPGRPAGMTAVEAEFSQYAELDAPTVLSAVPHDDHGAPSRSRGIEVVLRQGTTRVARMRVTTVTTVAVEGTGGESAVRTGVPSAVCPSPAATGHAASSEVAR